LPSWTISVTTPAAWLESTKACILWLIAATSAGVRCGAGAARTTALSAQSATSAEQIE